MTTQEQSAKLCENKTECDETVIIHKPSEKPRENKMKCGKTVFEEDGKLTFIPCSMGLDKKPELIKFHTNYVYSFSKSLEIIQTLHKDDCTIKHKCKPNPDSCICKLIPNERYNYNRKNIEEYLTGEYSDGYPIRSCVWHSTIGSFESSYIIIYEGHPTCCKCEKDIIDGTYKSHIPNDKNLYCIDCAEKHLNSHQKSSIGSVKVCKVMYDPSELLFKTKWAYVHYDCADYKSFQMLLDNEIKNEIITYYEMNMAIYIIPFSFESYTQIEKVKS